MNALRLVAWPCCALLSSLIYAQGPLAPSSGPGPVMRSLDQIEPGTPIGSVPFIITQPGTYYLTGNLHHGGAGIAIEVAASDVTIDGRGFVLTGTPSSGSLIAVTGTRNKVHIGNVRVGNSGQSGIELVNVRHAAIQNVHVFGSAGAGVRMSSGEIIGLVTEDNGGPGVFASNPVTGIGIVVKKHPNNLYSHRNGGGGVVIEGDMDIELSGVIAGNTGHGIWWQSTAPGDGLRMRLDECDVSSNAGDGLHISESLPVRVDCDFSRASFRGNGNDGLYADLQHPDASLVINHQEGSIVDQGGDGIDLTAGRNGRIRFVDVGFANNHGAGASVEVAATLPGQFVRCDARDNGTDGLHLSGGTWILEDSTIRGNTGDGIDLSAIKQARAGQVTITKRGGSSNDNGGSGLRVVATEKDAPCDIVIKDATFSSNASHGIHVIADYLGSSIALDWRDSVASGNGGSGLHLAPTYNSDGLHLAMEGGRCDKNGVSGLHVSDEHVRSLSIKRVGARQNTGNGIDIFSGACRFSEVSSHQNGLSGIIVRSPVSAPMLYRIGSLSVESCDASGNGQSGLAVVPDSLSAGVFTSSVSVAGGVFSGNGGNGISLDDSTILGGAISSATINHNGDNGISSIANGVVIMENRIMDNQLNGIYVVGNRHYLARNTFIGNTTGISLTGAGSAMQNNVYGGPGQDEFEDLSGSNTSTTLMDVITGTHPFGNVVF
jgi:hypothetical protein